ncbi:MAG: FKBP-type peptidyl-prolyl cis-trans isomerase [Thermoplasmatota archaeon]
MKRGEIVRWDYEGWTVAPKSEDCELFDTTDEKLAKEKGIYKERAAYGPNPIIVGAERLVKGLEASLLEAEVGREVEVIIPPADAFGERDARKMEIHSLSEILRLPEFRRGEREPVPGARVVLGNREGRIVSVRGGRVRVDYNHELAGKTLRYKYTIRSRVDAPEEKVAAILEIHYGRQPGFRVEVRGSEASITVAERCKFDPQWGLTKLIVVRDLREYVGLTTVRFVEEYVKPAEAPAPTVAAPEPGAAEAATGEKSEAGAQAGAEPQTGSGPSSGGEPPRP